MNETTKRLCIRQVVTSPSWTVVLDVAESVEKEMIDKALQSETDPDGSLFNTAKGARQFLNQFKQRLNTLISE